MSIPVVAAIGTAKTDTGSSTTQTLAKPSGVVAGDLMLAYLNFNVIASTADVIAVPSGWQLIHSPSDSVSTHSTFVYWKIAGGGEGSDYSWTSSNRRCVGVILRVTGVHASTPINDEASADVPSSTAAPNAPAVTTTVDECLVLRSLSTGQFDRTITIPGSHDAVTAFEASNGEFDNAVCSIEAASAGSVAAVAWSLSSATQRCVLSSIAIAPATAPSGNPAYYYQQLM